MARLNLEIPEALRRRAKVKAAQEQRTLTDVVQLARHPLTPAQATREVQRLLEADGLVRLPVDDVAVRLTLALARKHGVRGVAFFDALIVGTMLSHGVERLYTANAADFARFGEVEVVNPLAGSGRPGPA